LKITEIGCNWVMVTMTELVSEAWTMLPSSTWRMPVRPSIGATMVV